VPSMHCQYWSKFGISGASRTILIGVVRWRIQGRLGEGAERSEPEFEASTAGGGRRVV
jgi:hypothetical protein